MNPKLKKCSNKGWEEAEQDLCFGSVIKED